MAEQGEIREISAEEFYALEKKDVTVVDLREPDEVLIGGIKGAVNLPFSKVFQKLDTIPRERPVYLICSTGDLSGEVAEILNEREYEVYNVSGGYRAYRKVEEARAKEVIEVDAKGLKCPGPIVAVADALRDAPIGQQLHVTATEDAFVSDIRVWCERTGNRLLGLEVGSDGVIDARIERAEAPAATATGELPNDKTFVVFSGDLDKTIAAFIIANGAAAMGRKVTLFFTFWGLNILRRPERVKVKKDFIARMFGVMMPRGTKRLGLSRMNMCGAGAKMIRSVMKQKGVKSLEELIESAKAHGVRLVACQMSMNIMGIRREELIDGVELGGVSTFLGSGELSDMSLFI